MLKLAPLLLALIYGAALYFFSATRTAAQLRARSTSLADGPLQYNLARLAKALDLEAIRVNIYEIDAINGLAAPDGRIYITRGFLSCLERGEVSADELASVIAHELGHVALGHTRRRMIDFSGQNAVRVALSMVLGRFIPGIGPYLAGLLTSLLTARLSREDEYAADAYAAALLHKAGIGSRAQITLFEKLDALTGNQGRQLAWLMSHPASTERIKRIQDLSNSWKIV